MWNMSLPAWEFVLRAVVVYFFVLFLLRLTGKRQVGQLAPFDLVLLLILSNSVQNSMNGGDNSITAGIVLASTLIAVNWLIARLTYRNKRLEALVEGRPVILIHHGHIIQRAMDEARMTIHELNASLRAEGVADPREVLVAVLENNGKITVVQRKGDEA